MTTHIISKEDWVRYTDNTSESAGFTEYVEATEQITERLEYIVNKSDSFQELKEELITFISDRKSFINYAEQNLP